MGSIFAGWMIPTIGPWELVLIGMFRIGLVIRPGRVVLRWAHVPLSSHGVRTIDLPVSVFAKGSKGWYGRDGTPTLPGRRGRNASTTIGEPWLIRARATHRYQSYQPDR